MQSWTRNTCRPACMISEKAAAWGWAFQNRGNHLAAQTSTHLYLWPSDPLRPFVAHYTFCLGSGFASAAQKFSPLTILPDASGCLTFTLRGDGLDGVLYGPSSRAVQVQNDLGVCPLRFFVEFRPGGLSAFSRIPLWELEDQILPLADGEQGLDQLVRDCWRAAEDLDGFVEAVDEGLCARLRSGHSFTGLLAWFLDGGQSPEALAAETGYSSRHLTRLFRERCGLSPKRLQRIVRINTAAMLMQRSAGLSLTRLAQELDYFDQAHFIHDFRAVCGVTPGAYQARLSDFYNEPLKF